MPSLTPLNKQDEVVDQAFKEGCINGIFTLVPTVGAMFIAVQKSPWLRRSTNMQARTALCIMPALLIFGITSEEKVVNRMREMAKEAQHSHESVVWAERQLDAPALAHQKELTHLYRRAVYESGVRVVPGDQLAAHHIMANYVAENPFKVLASLAVPGVAWIFYGRAGQEHLTFSMKVMHTRVFGQFATISMLLGVMGFKEMMDRSGKFITEAQAENRVEEMQVMRLQMLQRLEATNSAKAAYEDAIQEAHDQDLKEGHASAHKKQKKQQKKPVETTAAATIAVSPVQE
jgi:hypothetical protein